MFDWRDAAYCATEHVEAYTTDNLPEPAARHECTVRARILEELCGPCPVWRECGMEALQYDTRGVIRAGIAFPDVKVGSARRRLMVRLGLSVDPLQEKAAVPRTHCDRDHELVGDNIIVRKDGARLCRACSLARGAERRAKAKFQRESRLALLREAA